MPRRMGRLGDDTAAPNYFANTINDYGSDLSRTYGMSPMPESYVETPVMFRAPYGPVDMPASKRESASSFGLTAHMIPGIPNYLLYGGVLAMAFFLATKAKK